MKTSRLCVPPLRAFSLAALVLLGTIAEPASALMIDAFRLRGPSGANDEYVQVYNESATSHTVAGGGTGYGIAASDGVTRCSIPNGTVIPGHGHYLCTNSAAYSLSGYATGDATFTTDIPDNAGIAIFNNNLGGGGYVLANRLDAVGSTSEANTLYKEGTGYPALTPFSINYSFMRDQCGRSGAIAATGLCPAGTTSVPIDTGNNAADFYFVDTNGTSAGAGQRLGAPGPQNLASPINGTLPAPHSVFDNCATDLVAPNSVHDTTSDPPNNSTFGTLDVRRTFTNNTGAAITRLRFRITDLTTFPAPSGVSDLRPRTSTALVVVADRSPCGSSVPVLVQGTTLEEPPSQPNGGGFYSTFSAPSVTVGTPLAAGATIDVRFLFGIQQEGDARFALSVEALPEATALFQYNSCLGTCNADLSITKTDGVTTVAPGGTLTYTIVASNAGPFGVTSATVADTFPASLTATWTCVGAGGGICTAAGAGNINDTTVTLPSGGSVTYTVTATVSMAASGSISNTATVTPPAGTTDPAPGNNSATDTDTVAISADLAITKTDGVTTVTAGGSTTYTITASNAGPGGATGAVVADTFPAALTVTWTCVGAGGGTCTAAGAGNINDTVNLPAGGSVTYTASATISGAATGTLSNTATVTAPAGVTDSNPGNNSATDTDTIGASANLGITKTDGVTNVMAGGSTTYTIVASNAGPSNAIGAVVADTFPASLTVTWTCTGAGGGTCTAAGAGNINDTVNLPAGGSVTYTASATINIAATGTLSNTATVTAPAGVTDPVPGNNSATDTDTITSAAVTTYSAPSPTGSGTITASFTGGGPGCTFASAAFVLPPAPVPFGLTFPHGLFEFTTTGCIVGSTLVFTVTYPQALAANTAYWKYSSTLANPADHWYVLPAAFAGNTATFSITDGGLGDDDLTANGSVVDPGGPAGSGLETRIPTLNQWMLLLLALVLLTFGGAALKRRRF